MYINISIYIYIHIVSTTYSMFSQAVRALLLGWSNNHFNNLHFRTSLETNK